MAALTTEQNLILNELDLFVPGLKRGTAKENMNLGDKIARVAPEEFTNLTRPSPSSRPRGTWIYNLDDDEPQYTDGTNWRDLTKQIT